MWKISKLGYFLPDKLFIKLKYYKKLHKRLNLRNPVTFNEKLQWLKLYDRRPEYTIMVDKFAAKKYVANIIGEKYIIPTLGVWDTVEDIDFESLPNQFVLKCTHDSGGLIICNNKADLNIPLAKEKLKRCLKQNYYLLGREWPYKNVPRRIIAEKFLSQESGDNAKDFYICNFNDHTKVIRIDYNRFAFQKRSLNNSAWDAIEDVIKFQKCRYNIVDKSFILEKMVDAAKCLSKNINCCRTEFYLIDDKIYFAEITFCNETGFIELIPEDFGVESDNWVNLSDGGVLIKGNAYYLWLHKEMAYPNTTLNIIQNEQDSKNEEPDNAINDYKVFNFNGEPKLIQVDYNRFTDHKRNLYTTDWELIDAEIQFKNDPSHTISKPASLNEMLRLARKLSKGFPHVRTDFYCINNHVYFGELTLYHGSGFERFMPEEFGIELGGYIRLPGDMNKT